MVAFDVLEHIDDDAAAAKEVFELLRPGGVFLVAVPCDPRLWSAHDEAVGHVRRYTRPELLSLLTGAGFAVDEVRAWMVLLRPAVALQAALEHRQRPRRPAAAGSTPPSGPWSPPSGGCPSAGCPASRCWLTARRP